MSEWIYKNKIISILLVLWMIGIVSWVTFKVFNTPPTTATVSAYGILFGLPALVLGMWRWRNSGNRTRGTDVNPDS